MVFLPSNLSAGDQEARVEADTTHSKLLQRGKFVHEKQSILFANTLVAHRVKPEAWLDYTALVTQEYARINADPRFNGKLFGSWETETGDLDTAFHIWDYDNCSPPFNPQIPATLRIWLNSNKIPRMPSSSENSRQCFDRVRTK
jgi:hypothetical protein